MNYKEVIESRYNRQKWQALLHDIFGNKADLWQTPYEISTNSALSKQTFWLGTITLSDGETIAVYEVELVDNVDIERNRRGIRDMLLTEWRNRDAGAFMFCYRKNESVLRFSYISEAWNFADDGSYTKEATDPKRFTYLLGEGHRSRTAIQQFEKLKASQLKLKDLTKAFSVEAVSDMFFNEYKKNYEDIIEYITGKRMVKVANKWEEKVMHAPCEYIMKEFAHFPNREKAVRDYVKKLMGRLVFLQFLQKKGWLGVPVNADWGNGDPEFIQNLYAKCQDKDHFVDNVLEELFNDLNSERTNDLVSSAVGNNIRVPYLNGGLFEREATDETEFALPAKYMQQMLDFFASYNFTIDENDPDDAEVGVDPEMLGRIFENLLEDNKDKGAFYTPKEIVTYMCRESLIAYLQTDIEDEETKEAVRQFVTNHEKNDKLPADTDQKLKDVKICDPAIGSGAFPMGLLKELFLCRTALEGIEQSKAAEIKKHIIQQNIYGVDIERGAVDIARLRFWLSLIVDEETPQALPNLDYKIVEGNSLITTFDGQYIDLEKGKGEARFRPSLININREKKLLQEEQKKFFTLRGDDKYRSEIAIKNHILNIIWYQLDFERHSWQDATVEQVGLFGSIETKGRKKNVAQIVEFTPERKEVLDKCEFLMHQINDKSKTFRDRASISIPFFEWDTIFSDVFEDERRGFNIVIGNPPYVSAPAQIANPFLANQREILVNCKKYETLNEKWDLYIPFIELGLKLLTNNGAFSMIVPYPLTNQKYGKKLRRYICEEKRMVEIADVSEIKVFDSATVSNCIPFIINTSPNDDIRISHADKQLNINVDYHKTTLEIIQDEKTYVWNLTQETRIGNRFPNMHVLGDFCYISKGMVLNADEKAAKGEFVKDDLISNSKDVIHNREYIEAKDIDKYEVKRVRYLEWNTERCPNQLSRPTFRELYDCTKLMFNRLGVLKVYLDTNIHFLHSDSMFSAVLWKDLHYVSNKSITSSITKFCNNKQRSELENLSEQIDLYYLLGILNSHMAGVLLSDQRGGDYHIYPEHIRNIPIPVVSKDKQEEISAITKRILTIKHTNPSQETYNLEFEIDNLVYHFYGLTYDEVLIVDPETPFTREEYDKYTD